MPTPAQFQTLKAGAMADPTAAAFIAAGDDYGLADWLNATAPGPVKAWRSYVDRADIFDATPITNFDGLTAGKRDAWKLLIDNAPVDFSRNKVRAAVVDIWAAAQATSILTDMTENATRAESIIGGSTATDATVTALRRDWVGVISPAEASLVRVA
jgi:hypothetical protein